MKHPRYLTAGVSTPGPWHVVVDDLIGGWAVATAPGPTSAHDPERGEFEVANFLRHEDAELIVRLRNATTDTKEAPMARPGTPVLLTSGDSYAAEVLDGTVRLHALADDRHVEIVLAGPEAARLAQRVSMLGGSVMTTQEQAAFLVEGLAVAADLIRGATTADSDPEASPAPPAASA